MPRLFWLIMLLLGSGGFILDPVTVHAAITQVTLFPDSATIKEKGSISLQKTGKKRTGFIMLPGQADPASLTFFPPKGVSLLDISPESIVAVDTKRLAKLKQELAALTTRKGKLEARKKSLAARIDFWKSRQAVKQGSLAQMKKLAAAMSKEIEEAMLAISGVSQKLQQVGLEIAAVKKRMTAIQGKKNTTWKITLGFSSGTANSLACFWSYEVRGCGWTPVYRLEALPGKKQVRFLWQAKVHQSTGVDWKNVALSLATGKTHMQPEPQPVRPWILRSIQPRRIDRDKFMQTKAAAPRAVMYAEKMALPNEAWVEHRKGTFSLWELGSRSVMAGEDTRVRVKEMVWPASFHYVLRPSTGGRSGCFGFLQTLLELKQPLDLPYGEAMLLVDGAFLHKQGFSFSGKKLKLFFGPDPLVTAKTVLKKKQTGTGGIFSRKETWVWDWELVITNNKHIPIEALVEEPRPLSRNEDIRLDIVSTPVFKDVKENPDIMVWPLHLAPGASQTISLHVEAKASRDMKVDPGWRW